MAQDKDKDKKIRFYLSLLITILVFVAIMRYSLTHLNKLNIEYHPPNLHLAKVFTNNMLLQRNEDIVIWGKAHHGKTIKIKFKDHDYEAIADEKDNWRVHLGKHAAGGPYDIQIKSDKEELALNNVLLGDQILVLGEAIVNFPLSQTNNFEHEISAAEKLSSIRYFNADYLPEKFKFTELNQDATWQVIEPKTVSQVPAIAYYLAKHFYDKSKVPIGIIKVAEDYATIESLSKLPKTNKTKTTPRMEHDYQALFGTDLNLANGQTIQLCIDKITEGDLSLYINEERIGQIKNISKVETFTIPSSLLKSKYNKIELRIINVDDMVQLSRDQLNLTIRLSSGAGSETVLRPGYQWKYRKRTDLTQPAIIYQELLQPLLQMKFSHILMYQGDSNLNDTSNYRALFVSWIQEIETQFKTTKIIFLGLRNIDSYNPDQNSATQIRSIQRQVLAAHPNIKFIDTNDLEFKANSAGIAARYFQ